MADPAGTKIVRVSKNAQTDHFVVSDNRRRPEEAEKSETQCGAISSKKMSEETPRIKVQPVTGSLQELRNLQEDARGTLS